MTSPKKRIHNLTGCKVAYATLTQEPKALTKKACKAEHNIYICVCVDVCCFASSETQNTLHGVAFQVTLDKPAGEQQEGAGHGAWPQKPEPKMSVTRWSFAHSTHEGHLNPKCSDGVRTILVYF